MPPGIRKRPRIGDVIEIPTPRGFAYAHYTHKHELPPRFGALIRVFAGTHEARPQSFTDIVHQTPQFMTFYPLGAACNRGMVYIAGHEPVPKDAQLFPTFRSGFPGPQGRVQKWSLWDGVRNWTVDALSPEMTQYPILAGCNHAILVDRILSGWRHEHVT